jgi:hypothetical protein
VVAICTWPAGSTGLARFPKPLAADQRRLRVQNFACQPGGKLCSGARMGNPA